MAHDIEVSLGDHVLQHGDVLENDVVQARMYGNPDGPLVVIPGGISASRFLADNKENGHGWWVDMVYEGGPIDLNEVQVLGLDLAPTGQNAQKRLTITTNDQAKRLKAVLDHLGVAQADSVIGMSYGGMVALAFAQDNPDRLKKLCLLGATHRPYPMGVGWRGIQRRVIKMGIDAGRPNEGLKLARELAMMTYRSAEEFSERFDAAPTQNAPFRFDVGDYLEACGSRYHEIMAVERFMAMSESIDLHNVDPAKVTTPTLLIATRSDQLAPPSEVKALHDALAGPCDLVEIDSLFGHDSFLKEYAVLGPILSEFTKEQSRAA